MKLKLNYSTALCALLAVLFQQSAMAATVDFENESPLIPDPTLFNVGDSYVNGSITFTSTEIMQLVGVGLPRDAFVPNDTPGSTTGGVAAEWGDVFLTGDFNDNTDMKLTFATDLTAISFEIADIDGGRPGDDGGLPGNNEKFTFVALKGGAFVADLMILATGSTPDAQVDLVSFSGVGLFDEIQIIGITDSGTRNIGWGIDNINTSPVPLPAAAWLFGSALLGLGVIKRRKA